MTYNCVCGANKVVQVKRDYYHVTPEGVTEKAPTNGLLFGKCSVCNIVRQVNFPFADDIEYKRFYAEKYPPVSGVYVEKSYEHDRLVAIKRCEAYRIEQGNKVLDIGSGSGAFVDECRERGIDTYGCELGNYDQAKNSDFIYKQEFIKLNFPTDHFEVITCHDVLEHIIDPVAFIKEMFRVVNQNGRCIIDFPDYYIDEGSHHWKTEHIWYFTITQLKTLLEREGFIVDNISKPIPSKIVFYLKKLAYDRPTILVPPGIGDSYWSITKLQAFLKRENLDIPDICVLSPRDKEFEAHKRSFPFLEMFPFVKSSGEVLDGVTQARKDLWREAYINKGKTIFTNIDGYDYFIAYNGQLRHGVELENVDRDLQTDWFPPMFVSLEQQKYQQDSINKYGKYIVFYFVFQGTYKYWTNEFPVSQVIKSIKSISSKTGYIPVIVGAAWDSEDNILKEVKSRIPNCIDLTGKTTLEQLFGLIKGSQVVVGYPSGITIMSAVFKIKTMIIWNDYYNKDFFWNCAPPSTRNKTYFIANTKGLNTNILTSKVVKIINNG